MSSIIFFFFQISREWMDTVDQNESKLDRKEGASRAPIIDRYVSIRSLWAIYAPIIIRVFSIKDSLIHK